MKPLSHLRSLVTPAALALAATVQVAALAGPAHATVIYDWSGTCTADCTGTASGVLTLAPTYVPGTPFGSDFVSFVFNASGPAFSLSFPPVPVFPPIGDLPLVSGPALANVLITDGSLHAFNSLTDGRWFMNTATENLRGVEGTFVLRTAAVPEPGSLTLFAFALGALVFLRKRRRWSSMVASAVAWRFRSRSWSPTRRAPDCAIA